MSTEYCDPLEAIKNCKFDQYQFAAIENCEQKTYRGICKVVANGAHSARRDLSEGSVTEAKLFDQECIVTEQVGCFFGIPERRDRVSLWIVVRLWNNLSFWGGM